MGLAGYSPQGHKESDTTEAHTSCIPYTYGDSSPDLLDTVQFSSVQSLSHVRLFAAP